MVVVVAEPGPQGRAPAGRDPARARAAPRSRAGGRARPPRAHGRHAPRGRAGTTRVFLIGADEFARLRRTGRSRRRCSSSRGWASRRRPGYPGALDDVLAGLATRARPLLRDRAVARLLARDPGASRPRRADRRARPARRGGRDRRRRALPRAKLSRVPTRRSDRLTPLEQARRIAGSRPGEAGQGRRHPGHAAGVHVHRLLRDLHGPEPAADEGDLRRGAQRPEGRVALAAALGRRRRRGDVDRRRLPRRRAARLHPGGAGVLRARGSLGRRAVVSVEAVSA